MSLTAASKSGPNGSEYKFVSRRDIISQSLGSDRLCREILMVVRKVTSSRSLTNTTMTGRLLSDPVVSLRAC